MLIIGCDFHTRYQQIAMLDDGGWHTLRFSRPVRDLVGVPHSCAVQHEWGRFRDSCRSSE